MAKGHGFRHVLKTQYEPVRFVDEPQARFAKMSFEQASDYVLTKNAELYKRLILGFEDTVPPELKNRIRKAEMMMDDPKKHLKSMRVR